MANDGFPPTSRYEGKHGPIPSGVSPTMPDRVLATTDTMVKAAQLRAAGATFREIGEALSLDPTHARTLVLRALKNAEYESADLMRTQEGVRLDRLQRAFWQPALAGDEKAAAVVLRVMDRRARLFGLDAPTKVEVTEVVPEVGDVDHELRVIMGVLASNDESEPPEGS